MSLLGFIVILLVSASLLSFINTRWFHWPPNVSMLTAGLVASLFTVCLGEWGTAAIPYQALTHSLRQFNFSTWLLHGLVPVLLFAGGLQIDFVQLRRYKSSVTALAVLGTFISTFVIGLATYALLRLFHHPISLMESLLFGALISPTDPIAVIGLLRFYTVPEQLEILIAGESLFNDGVAIVIFMALLESLGSTQPIMQTMARLFLEQTAGGLCLGLVFGLIAYQAIKRIDEANSEMLITVALVAAIGWTSVYLHVSAALAALVAGLLIGNLGRRFGMSATTRQALEIIWSFADYVLNVLLFLILGLEVLTVHFSLSGLSLLMTGILIVLVGRMVSVGSIAMVPAWKRQMPLHAIPLLIWGGLRGGIPVALALSLPGDSERELLLQLTYANVLFSILVQAPTFKLLLTRLQKIDRPNLA